MNQVLEIFSYGFMQRALVGAILVSVLSGVVGVFLVLKRAAFYSDAVAHSALTGVAIGILIGLNPVIAAGVYSVLVAIILPWLKKKAHVPLDSLLGFLLPFSMALGVLLLAAIPGYKPELLSFLFGNILAIDMTELAVSGVLGVLVLAIIAWKRYQLLMVAFDEIQAKIMGISVQKVELLFNVLTAITVVIGVRVVGIVLINALLIIPATTVRMFAKSFWQMMWITPLVSLVLSLGGILVSVGLDWPTGPTIALIAGGFFLCGVLVRNLIGWNRHGE